MCGISGFIGKGTFDDLKRMNDAITHRGPDAEGFWQDELKGVFLGHRRLSIIDIGGGAQPMWTADNAIGIVFNGEIYNHEELRKQLVLKGYKFQSNHSDTEVLLHGYREWGNDLPNHLNGMWAFVIYDKAEQRVFASRDRFGKKPFFYSLQNGAFVFASELSAVCKHSLINKKVSQLSLKKYFAYGYIPAPNTIYEKINKLPGGCNLTLNTNTLTYSITRYWDFILEPTQNVPKNPEQEWGGQILDLLDKAVKKRLMSDVPLGVFLSGGIDSSSIAYYASKNMTGHRLKTFSIGFEEESFDESVYSGQMASLLNTEHYQEKLSLDKALALLPSITSKLDEPMGDSSLLPTYLLCRETRKHVTVALGGDGADELFAGYDPFRAIRYAEAYSKLVPKPLHKAITFMLAAMPTSHRNMSMDFKIKRTLRGLSYKKQWWNSIWLGPLDPKLLAELFNEPVNEEEVYSEAIEQWDNCEQKNIIDKTLQFYTKIYLQDDILVKVDRASMMNSLEVRAPFLDIDLVNFVRTIPNSYKYRNGETKYILKKALEKVLPHNILYRPKKGFGIPIGKWFMEGKLEVVTPVNNMLFNKEFISSQLSQHRQGKADNRAFLWNMWLLNEWGK